MTSKCPVLSMFDRMLRMIVGIDEHLECKGEIAVVFEDEGGFFGTQQRLLPKHDQDLEGVSVTRITTLPASAPGHLEGGLNDRFL